MSNRASPPAVAAVQMSPLETTASSRPSGEIAGSAKEGSAGRGFCPAWPSTSAENETSAVEAAMTSANQRRRIMGNLRRRRPFYRVDEKKRRYDRPMVAVVLALLLPAPA